MKLHLHPTAGLRRRARALAASGDRGSQVSEYAWIAGGLSAAAGLAIVVAVTDVVDTLLGMLQSALP